MKYSVGQKVKIRSLEWYRDNVNRYGIIECGKYEFFEPMNEYCGKVVTIKRIDDDNYRIDADKGAFCWADEMIEGLVEEENTLKTQSDNMETETHRGYYTTEPETTIEGKKRGVVYFWDNDFADKVELDLSNRELIQEDGKWFVVKKKKEYPKTYEECREIVKVGKEHTLECEIIRINNYKIALLESFQKLLICRDAYWKLYGEEMGLGKPWKPDYMDLEQTKFCIIISRDEAEKWETAVENYVLSFPTKEMRDAFYENFKDLIEQCKELL